MNPSLYQPVNEKMALEGLKEEFRCLYGTLNTSKCVMNCLHNFETHHDLSKCNFDSILTQLLLRFLLSLG